MTVRITRPKVDPLEAPKLWRKAKALLGASKRKDRTPEARLKSGHKYNAVYNRLTGDRFVITLESVMSEDIYVLDKTPHSDGKSDQEPETTPESNKSEPSRAVGLQATPESRTDACPDKPVVPNGYYDAANPPPLSIEEAEALLDEFLRLDGS